MSRPDNWIKMDKALSVEFKHIRREFSEIEAMYSYTLDRSEGRDGSISGYSTLWSWSRNRVRKFLQNITSKTGHYRDRKRTETGHPIHYIDGDLQSKPDANRTETGQKPDTTDKNKNKNNIYSRVVTYLNAKTKSNFKSTTKTTVQHIKARVNEGFSPEDFKSVIDFKCSQWLGDPENQEYLRPQTLFGTKFESYLNAAKRKIVPLRHEDPEIPLEEQEKEFLS